MNSVKYLGVTIDKFIKWDVLIAISPLISVKKIRSMFYKFKTLNCFLLPITMQMVYCGLAQSVYSYGLSARGSAWLSFKNA